jgi:Arc/MetJ-type ribon-helix-helix transcriptional regulator
MPASVRLDRNTQARLDRLVRTTGRTKSDLIREAIVRLDEALNGEEGPTLQDQLGGYVGLVNLGPGDRARRSEELLRRGFGRGKER